MKSIKFLQFFQDSSKETEVCVVHVGRRPKTNYTDAIQKFT